MEQARVALPFDATADRHAVGLWLDRLVAGARRLGPVSQQVTLTEALAEVLTEPQRNPRNRPLNDVVVNRYAHDIKAGNFDLNGQSVVVSDTGELNDGQHRCYAVIEARKPIEVFLVVGVSRDSRKTLDQGKVRNIGDILTMDGVGGGNSLGSAANYLWQFRQRSALSTSNNFHASRADIMDVIASTPGLAESLRRLPRQHSSRIGGIALLTFCHFSIARAAGQTEADLFCRSLLTGEGLHAGDAAYYARERLMHGGRAMTVNVKAELIFRAWNAYRRGDRVTRLPLSGGGPLPRLEG